ncbi:MAG: HAD family phosphatase, partial [Firmicutes bacterium]|nr:HAD family phosphatase [Bacillota bacterium]
MSNRNAIFDIGNVLLSFRPKEYLRSLGFSEEGVELYYRIVFESKLWLELDRGVIDEREAVAQLTVTYPQHARGIQRVFADWYDMF